MGYAENGGNGRLAAHDGMMRRLAGSRDGVAAIEFAILALPFFLIVFAIIETFVAYAGEQLLENAVDDLSRKIRTGQITAANTDEAAFRAMLCDEISIMMRCADAEAGEQNLYIDVRSFGSFADMPTEVPIEGGDLDTDDFDYAPGGPQSNNMVRVYYRWPIVTDLIRPYISTVHSGSAAETGQYLMVATAAFTNENYPSGGGT
jgi:Flp pilus assembly protein TadG